MSTCPACKQSVSGGKKYRGKEYHPECYQKMIDAAIAKDAKKAIAASDPDLIGLKSYLLNHFELDALTPMLEKQIEQLSKQYSYATILYCLRYFFDLSDAQEDYSGEPSIGIVPYVYTEAMKYKNMMDAAKEANAHFTLPDTETVHIRPQKSSYRPLSYRLDDL